MAAATAAEVAAVDAAVRELRAQYARARVRVEANTGGWFASPQEGSISKAFADVGALLERWATVYRRWAVNRMRDDGTPYEVSAFLGFGRGDIGDAVELISKEAYDRSLFAAVKYTAGETLQTINPLNWPLKVQLLAGAGVLVLVVAVVMVARRGGA